MTTKDFLGPVYQETNKSTPPNGNPISYNLHPNSNCFCMAHKGHKMRGYCNYTTATKAKRNEENDTAIEARSRERSKRYSLKNGG
jgi:hypothetical protein